MSRSDDVDIDVLIDYVSAAVQDGPPDREGDGRAALPAEIRHPLCRPAVSCAKSLRCKFWRF